VQYWANLPSTAFAAGAAEWAVAREREGWDGVCVSDHLFIGGGGPFPHVWVKLTEVACATSRIGLTTSFANNLFRSPVEFAHAALTLQQTSGGRFEAGLGAGWAEEEMVLTGREFPPGRVRVQMLKEALTIARQLLTSGGCRFEGDHYKVDVADGVFSPLLAPELAPPPLIVSAGGRVSVGATAGLVDRLELTSTGPATRGGALDFSVYQTIGEELFTELIAVARDKAPELPIGTYVMVAVGDSPMVEMVRGMAGDGLLGRFVGEPSAVAQALADLEGLGLDRVQLTEMAPGSIDALAPHLHLEVHA
jgi:alkanesulfonate monooxygenase SsuD/methylene tetrahydromethanopterin reductase-like flavin-dependent oxidoreductase (luciferase family)